MSNNEHRVRRFLAAVSLGVFMTLVGCGDDSDTTSSDVPGETDSSSADRTDVGGTEPTAQPGLQDGEFGQGDFDEIPLIPGSEQVGPIEDHGDGVLTATYTVNQKTAERAIQEMADLLDLAGWRQLIAPVERPEGAYRTEWTDEKRRLEVVATDVSGLDEAHRMQYSLLLHPDLDDTDVNAGRPSTG